MTTNDVPAVTAPTGRVWRIVKWILLCGQVLIVAAALGRIVYEAAMHQRDVKRFSQEGRSVPLPWTLTLIPRFERFWPSWRYGK